MDNTDAPGRGRMASPSGFGKGIGGAKEKQIVGQMKREELEDRYLTLCDEHLEVKKHSRKQEEKMKQMATKLVRLVKDRKKFSDATGGRNIDLHEKSEELQIQVRDLTKQNDMLKNKLTVARQQLHTHAQRQTPYGHVKSRIRQHARSSSAQPSNKINYPRDEPMTPTPEPRIDLNSSNATPALPQPRYGHSLLEEARIEKNDLQNQVSILQDEVSMLKDDIDEYKRMLRQKDLDHEEDLGTIRSQMTGAQKGNIQENVELIKLQREVRNKSQELQNLQSKYENIEQMLSKLKKSHEEVLDEMELQSRRLSEEQSRSATLQNELRKTTISSGALNQKEEQIKDLRGEIQLLKDAHQKLMKSTFTIQREQEFRSREKQYELRIAELESVIKADLMQKNELLDRLTQEQGSGDKSERDFKKLQVDFFTMKEEYDDMKEKMRFFENESQFDPSELQEALLLIQKRKESAAAQNLDFLAAVEDEMGKDLQPKIHQLQAAHADTINELDKTRGMLKIQHDINKDYEKEVRIATRKLHDLQKEGDTRLQEYAQLLDARTVKIKKLESQLKDIAYGTKQYTIQQGSQDNDVETDIEIELERGQNVFEIHIGTVTLLEKTASVFAADPSLFITFDFFEHEIQITSVMQGRRVDFNFTSQYIVHVDDFFLHFLQKESSRIELHQAIGTEYKSLASGTLRLSGVLDDGRQGRWHFSLQLQEIDARDDFATVDGWVRLRVPMEQALRLFKERSKAIGYIYSNISAGPDAPTPQKLDAGMNELTVRILQCRDVTSKQKDVQPSAYAVYKFYDFPDCDTPIVAHSNRPQFNFTNSFPVPMSEDLDRYLKSESLAVYVFDDNDSAQVPPLGIATIPLISLAHDKPVQGTFDIKEGDGGVCGCVDIELRWSVTYLPCTRMVTTVPKLVSYDDPGDLQSAARGGGSSGVVMQPLPSDIDLRAAPISTSTPAQSATVLDDYARSVPTAAPRSKSITAMPATTQILAPTTAAMPTTSMSTVVSRGDVASSVTEATRGDEAAPLITPAPRARFRGDVTQNTLEDTQTPILDADKPVASPRPSNDNVNVQPESGNSDANVQPAGDTMFAESDEDSDDDLVVSSATFTRSSIEKASFDAEDTDSEDVVVSSVGSKSARAEQPSDVVTITISSLTFFDNASIFSADSVTQFFVSYRFLDVDPESLETPMSLPKLPPNQPLSFNFRKVFHVDQKGNNEARLKLRNMLTSEDRSDSRIFFTVVSDPVDDQDGSCDDIAIAYVDLLQVLERGRDLVDEDIDVVDLLGSIDVIGALTVSIEVVDALRSFYVPT